MYQVIILLMIGIIVGCQEDEEQITPPVASDTIVVDSTIAIDLKGYVQKGPFINGTAITLSELDKKLVATGKNFTTQIADNRGSFSLKDIRLKSNFVQLQADGFYFDEVKGEKSAAQLTLFALADISDASSVNVNLLSHLERNRVVYLMQEDELDFSTAKQQAQQEVLTTFGIVEDSIGYSEQLDISQNGDQNAILLAISAVLQADNSVAELSELLGNFITDLREDGTINSEAIQTQLTEQAKSLDLPQIRQHLEDRYAEMGVEATIPNFEQYIDSDGDGILNKDEDDTPTPFSFAEQKDVTINTVVRSNSVKISGLKENGTSEAVIAGKGLLLNGTVTTDSTVNIKNGDVIQFELTSSSRYADTVGASITVGGLISDFRVVTDDYVPDAFSFAPIKDVAINAVQLSDTIIIAGLPHPTPAHITQGTLVKNGTEIEEDSTLVSNGDQLSLKINASPDYATEVRTTLEINKVMANFEVITDDYVPDNFIFEPINNASFDSLYTSETITLSGLPHPTPITLDQGSLLINGQIVNDLKIRVSNGDQVAMQLQSGSDFDNISIAPFRIGAVEDTFRVITHPNVWQRKSKFPMRYVRYHSGFTINKKLFIGTGASTLTEFGGETQAFYSYDPSIDTWKRVADFIGPGREEAIGFVINNKGYLGLGYKRDNNNGVKYNDFYQYDPSFDTWNQIASFPGKISSGMISFAVGDYGYVGLGATNDERTGRLKSTYEFWRYDPATDQWSQMASLPSEYESWLEGVAFSANGKGYVSLGLCEKLNQYDASICQEIWEYDPTSNTWAKISDYPDTGHIFSVAFVIGDYLYIGGSSMDSDEDDNPYKNFWRYHFNSKTWDEIDLGSFYFSFEHHYGTDSHGYHFSSINYEEMFLYEFTPPQDPRYFIDSSR